MIMAELDNATNAKASRPMKFDLVMIKTANLIGWTIPPNVLVRATKVIK